MCPTFETLPLIRCRQLGLITRGRQRLNGLNLDIQAGECLAVIGASGAGKSSLAKLLLGLVEGQLEGELQVLGQDIGSLPSAALACFRGRAIAMLPQSLAEVLNPQMTVLQQVMESLAQHQPVRGKALKQAAVEALERGNLPAALYSRYPRMLSGGEVQRLLLVLALLHQPRLLILDEPTAALDQQASRVMLHRLQALRGHTAQLLISHDLALVRQLADRVLVLDQGRVIEVQPTHQLFAAPQSPITRKLLQHLAMPSASQQPANSRRPPLLQLQDASLCVHQRCLFHRLNLRLNQGDLCVVQGASGCGKSTLARLLAGWIPLQEGQLHLNLPRGETWRSALIAQHPYTACAPHQRIARILAEPCQLAGCRPDRQQLKTWLDAVRLPATDEFLDRLPSQLSGGELQRVVIARALSQSPHLLIADEPTSALDPDSRHAILELLLQQQQQKGFALLIFTHDPAVARFLQTDAIEFADLQQAFG